MGTTAKASAPAGTSRRPFLSSAQAACAPQPRLASLLHRPSKRCLPACLSTQSASPVGAAAGGPDGGALPGRLRALLLLAWEPERAASCKKQEERRIAKGV